MKSVRIIYRITAVAALTTIGIVVWRWGGEFWVLFRNQAAVQARIASFGPWAPLAGIALNAVQVIVVLFPGGVIYLANGYLFGVWLGALYNLTGIMIGSTIVLLLTRRWCWPWVTRLVHNHERLGRLDHLVARRGRLFFFLVFLFPFMPKGLACYAVGLTDLPLGQMLVLIALGRLPGLFVASWAGADLASLSPTLWALLIVGACALGLAYLRWSNAIESVLKGWIEHLSSK